MNRDAALLYSYEPGVDLWINPPSVVQRDSDPLHEWAGDEDRDLIAWANRWAVQIGIRRDESPIVPLICANAAVPPEDARVAVVQASIARAAACGLQLPIMLVRFTQSDHGDQDGDCCTMGIEDNLLVRVSLKIDVPLCRLPGTVLHEAQHAADMRSGLIYKMETVERERRAIIFSHRASEGWQP